MGAAIILFASLFSENAAQSGQVVYQNMFAQYSFVQGVGKSRTEARKDALNAIPPDFIIDETNSPYSECVDQSEGALFYNAKTKDYECRDGRYRATIPIAPKDKRERAAYLKGRDFKKYFTVVGTGKTLEEADKDLKAKLPVSGFMESWSLGCTVQTGKNEKTGELLCDPSIPGNKYEKKAHLLMSNL